MTFLMTLNDGDLFPSQPVSTNLNWQLRRVGKVVIFDNADKVALIGNTVNEYLLLPGGGIKDGEGIREGALRECEEETGYKIELTHTLGVTEDYRSRSSQHSITTGYVGRIIRKGSQSLTVDEKQVGLYVRWVSIEVALQLLSAQVTLVKANEVAFYNTCFNIRRDFIFLLKATEYRKRTI
jgi:ADP-ribose pyrophosphatase YjhB (NUDIX family)